MVQTTALLATNWYRVQRLGPRLRGASGSLDPLNTLKAGMERLAVRDADQRLAELLIELASG